MSIKISWDLLGVAKIQKPSYFKLLLYSLVGVLDPSHRTAIIEVHRARENGLVVNFDGVIQRLSNTFPPLPVPPNPLLPASKAKRLGDGATKLAQLKFSEQGRQSIAGLNLMQFAILMLNVKINFLVSNFIQIAMTCLKTKVLMLFL